MTAPAGLRTWPAAGDPRAEPTERWGGGAEPRSRVPVRSPERTRLPRRTARTRSSSAPSALRRSPASAGSRALSRGALLGARGWVQAPGVPVPSRPGRPRPAQLIAAVAVTLAVVGALDLLGQTASTEVPARTAVPAETAVVRVGAGETVWDVARRVAPESDPRAVVDQIRQLNRMVGSAVEPGEQLQVPDGR